MIPFVCSSSSSSSGTPCAAAILDRSMAENLDSPENLEPRLDPNPSDFSDCECKLSRPSLNEMLGRCVCPGTTRESVLVSIGFTLPFAFIPRRSLDLVHLVLALRPPASGAGVVSAGAGAASVKGLVSSVLASPDLVVAPFSLLHPADLGLLGALPVLVSPPEGGCMRGFLSFVESSPAAETVFAVFFNLLHPADAGLFVPPPDSTFVSLALLFALSSCAFVIPMVWSLFVNSCSYVGATDEVSYGK